MRTRLCKCGCFGFVNLDNVYINGHNRNECTPWNRGLTKEIDKRVLDYALKNVESVTSLWEDPAYRFAQRVAHLGNAHTEETKERIRRTLFRGGSKGYCSSWFYEDFKNYILERDNYECQNPLCWKKENQKLHRHHIDYDKRNCVPDNLITLCNSCNVRANYNRDIWEGIFSNISH